MNPPDDLDREINIHITIHQEPKANSGCFVFPVLFFAVAWVVAWVVDWLKTKPLTKSVVASEVSKDTGFGIGLAWLFILGGVGLAVTALLWFWRQTLRAKP